MKQAVGNSEVLTEVAGAVGYITLNRPKALNALNLGMVRALSAVLRAWRADPSIHAVAIRGSNKEGPFGGFCAGGDIRFFHGAALAGDPELEDFFTEEYALNHLIHTYPKPYLAFMDGIVMGGGMGISQGASHRLVTSRTKMAMPETHIGLFPDVGGGYFLSRCPGRTGEWLALTGEVLDAQTAMTLQLADGILDANRLPQAWEALAQVNWQSQAPVSRWMEEFSAALPARALDVGNQIDACFSMLDVSGILRALELDGSEWACQTIATLRKRSPLMLHVTLEQVRRARFMDLATDLRMERDLVRHCFSTRHLGRAGALSETVEGIRALAIDKDHQPLWSPVRIEDVTPSMVAPFFDSPWPAHAHPLASLA